MIALIPAAGRAERFGSQKLIAPIDGVPMLERTVRSVIEGGASAVIVVVAPESALTVLPALADARVRIVVNPDPSRGMFSSIQAGVVASGDEPMLVLPGDMPFVDAATVAAVAEACVTSGRVVLPRHAGRHGHPVALPGRLRAAIAAADATSNLSEIIKADLPPALTIDVVDRGVLRDVDVREDLPDQSTRQSM